jgi:hypothetical protein
MLSSGAGTSEIRSGRDVRDQGPKSVGNSRSDAASVWGLRGTMWGGEVSIQRLACQKSFVCLTDLVGAVLQAFALASGEGFGSA